VPVPPAPPTTIRVERIHHSEGNNPEDAIIVVTKDGNVQKFIRHKEVTVKSDGQTIQSEEKIIWKDEKGFPIQLDDIDPTTIKSIDVKKSPKGQKSESTTVTVITSEKNLTKNLGSEEIKTIDVRKADSGEELIIINGVPLNNLRPLQGTMEGKELFVRDSTDFPMVQYSFQPGNVKSFITSQLMRDQIISNEKDFQMELTSAYLKIDGKKFVGPYHAKYLKIFESQTGLKMDSKSKISISGKE
jgi:hypothetical protein